MVGKVLLQVGEPTRAALLVVQCLVVLVQRRCVMVEVVEPRVPEAQWEWASVLLLQQQLQRMVAQAVGMPATGLLQVGQVLLLGSVVP